MTRFRFFHFSVFSPLLLLCALTGMAVAADPVDPASNCSHCPRVLDDIQASLKARCPQVPTREALRSEPVYIFLSIYDQVSRGVGETTRARVYQAALDGMACDDLTAGVTRANQVGRQLYRAGQ